MFSEEPDIWKRIGNGPFENITENITMQDYEDDHVLITRKTTVMVHRHYGIQVTALVKNLYVKIIMTWFTDFMNYEVHMPHDLCRVSTGHLGNCDNNPSNDESVPDQRKYYTRFQ